jgi:5'-nucleotidase
VRILVTNDDGIGAPGLHALVASLHDWTQRSGDGEPRELIVVAPDRNHSGAGAAVGEVYTRTSVPYRRRRLEGLEDVECFGLDASPALCVLVGVLGGIGARPDAVISGVNSGVNVGRSVLHSGTVGAVLSASQLGLSGMAVSIQWRVDAPYAVAADLAAGILDELLAAPPRTLFNLNVPSLERHELRGVRRGRISTAGIVKSAGAADGTMRLDEEGEIPLRLGSAVPALGDVSDEEPEDDGALVAAGFASLTPLRSVHEDDDENARDVVTAAIAAADVHLAAIG